MPARRCELSDEEARARRAPEDRQGQPRPDALDQRHPRPRTRRRCASARPSTGPSPPTRAATRHAATPRCAEHDGDAWAAIAALARRGTRAHRDVPVTDRRARRARQRRPSQRGGVRARPTSRPVERVDDADAAGPPATPDRDRDERPAWRAHRAPARGIGTTGPRAEPESGTRARAASRARAAARRVRLCGGAGTSTWPISRAVQRASELDPVLVCDTGGPTGGLADHAGVATPRSLLEVAEHMTTGLPPRGASYVAG